jgi:S-adenosylmethionine synthetase
MTRTLTAESVTEGHSDKVADYIADSILDAYLAEDPYSRVACEALCKGTHVVIAGEITSRARVDRAAVVRAAVRDVGYADPASSFHATGIEVIDLVSAQGREIANAVGARAARELRAGDQGIMIGYATGETPERLPLPLVLAHRLTRTLAEDRRSGAVPWLLPDGKSQVSVEQEGEGPRRVRTVVVSLQHRRDSEREAIERYVREGLLPRALGPWNAPDVELLVNPAGSFVEGGPVVDCGLTGRKSLMDAYGPLARHGGGAFSGKDPTKVDRSGAYLARLVARQIVDDGIAPRVEVQVAYAIGRSLPVALSVDTFGTGDAAAAGEVARAYDFRPGSIIERLRLLRPIYRLATNYGHFGRRGLPWEEGV